MHRPTLVAALLAATAVVTPAAAQPASSQSASAVSVQAAGAALQPRASGRIVGVVTAPDGARLPGAAVLITNLASGSSVTVVTANHGGYSGSNLPPGDYDVEARSAGFQAQVARGVAVRSGASIEANFTLPLSTVIETVTVQGVLVKDSIESTGIRDANVRDIGEALSRLNGLSLVRKGAIANDIVLQGHQSRNLTVLIDGERIYGACPNGMDPAVFHADFAEVDHLEIAKGPFDVRHQGSLGGLVNVVTRAPGPGLHASPSFSSGSWGYINPSAVVSWGTPRVSALAGYSYRSANPYRDGSGALFTSYANYRPSAVDSQAFDIDTGWGRVSLAEPWPLRAGGVHQAAGEPRPLSLPPDGRTDGRRGPFQRELRRRP